MTNKRLPHTLTTEELLDLISKEETTTSEKEEIVNYPAMQNDVVAFLSHYEIKSGEDLVTSQMLHKLYSLWSKEPVSKRQFFVDVANFIIRCQRGPRYYYMINRSSLNLTNEAFKLINKQTHNKAKSMPWRQHFEHFLAKYNIRTGGYFLEAYVLYDLYDEYAYGIKRKNGLSPQQFINFCKVYFSVKHTKKAMYFGVDASIEETLTKQRIDNLRRNRILRHENKKNIKKK